MQGKDRKNKNLRNGTTELIYFRFVDTEEKAPFTRLRENKETGTKEIQAFEKTVNDKRYYTEEEVKKFSLERLRDPLPKEHGNFTGVDNYFLDFWGPILGYQATMVFIHLLRYCYGGKDSCFPDLDTMAAKLKMSIPTVRKYLEVLEKFGFIMRFWVQNPDNHNLMESCVYKVRRTVPMLSQEEVESLPDELKQLHEDYLEELMESHEITLRESYDTVGAYKDFEEQGRRVESPKTAKAEDLQVYYDARLNRYTDQRKPEDIKLWQETLSRMSKKITPSSMENWFTQSFCVANPKDQSDITIVCKNSFIKEWIETRYKALLEESMILTVGKPPILKFVAIVDLTREDNKEVDKVTLPRDLVSKEEAEKIRMIVNQ